MLGHSGNDNKVITLSKLVPNYYRNYHAKFEIDRTILTCLNKRKELFVTDDPILFLISFSLKQNI